MKKEMSLVVYDHLARYKTLAMNPMFLTIVFMAVAVVTLIFWPPFSEAEKPKPSGLPIKISRYYWPGQYWQEIAQKKGWFREAGLNVELVDTNSDYYGSLQDMVEGKMDANDFTLFDFLRFNLSGADLVMVVHTGDSYGVDALVAKEDIETIKDLQGKTVGVEKGSYLEYLLDVVLKRNGLSAADIRTVDIAAEAAEEAFIQKTVDAIMTWEPFVTPAIEKGNGRKLFDTSQLPGLLPSGTAFHRRFIEKRPVDVKAFVEVWQRTSTFIKEHPQEAFGMIAEIYRVPLEEVQAFAQIDKIMDLSTNRNSFSYVAGIESLHGKARLINYFLIDKGLVERQLDSANCLDGSFIKRLR